MDDPTPSYFKIKLDLLSRIAAGEWPVGAQIPPETVLAESYRVSRPTVRQAVLDLAREGHVIRERGRGTFVAHPVITKDAHVFSTFAEDMEKEGGTHRSMTISKIIVAASYPLARELHVAVGENLYQLVRLRLGNDEPLVLRTSFMTCSRFPGLFDLDLDNEPLYDVIRRRFGMYPESAVQTFRAIAASRHDARILGLGTGSPLLAWEGVIYDQNSQPIERVTALHRADKFRFVVSQGRESSTPRATNGAGILFKE